MERLAYTNKGMAWYKSDALLIEPHEMSHSQISEVLQQLAAYEETGLTPEEIKELAQAVKEGRLKIVKKPPEGACCGHCADFIRTPGTARGTCRTQRVKRYSRLRNELRKVSQSTNACAAYTPIEETNGAHEGTFLHRFEELTKADTEGRVLQYAPGDTVHDCFGMAWTVTSAEIHKFGDGPLRYLYRCGHPGTDDYCALYSEEIQQNPEAVL